MKQRVPIEKLLLIAQAILNSKIYYGSSVYLQPIFEKEDIKAEFLPTETRKLQTIQNNMIRMIFGYKMEDKTNMNRLRTRIKMFSVNQMCCYQVMVEAYNIINHGSSETIKNKWMPEVARNYPIRRNRMKEVKVSVPDHTRCQGFTLYGAQLWNQLPIEIREIEDSERFKVVAKQYIWENIPSF